MQVERIDFIALPVEDLARADLFYGQTRLMLHRRYAPYSDGTKP